MWRKSYRYFVGVFIKIKQLITLEFVGYEVIIARWPIRVMHSNLSMPENLVLTSVYERLSPQTLEVGAKSSVG